MHGKFCKNAAVGTCSILESDLYHFLVTVLWIYNVCFDPLWQYGKAYLTLVTVSCDTVLTTLYNNALKLLSHLCDSAVTMIWLPSIVPWNCCHTFVTMLWHQYCFSVNVLWPCFHAPIAVTVLLRKFSKKNSYGKLIYNWSFVRI